MKRRRITSVVLTFLLVAAIAPTIAGAQPVPHATKRGSQPAHPATATWTDKAVEPVRTYFHAAASDGSYLYILGGSSYDGANFVDVNNLQRYNPATDTWTQLATPTGVTSITSAAACAMNGKIYVFGGQVNGSYSPGVLIYTIAANSWSNGPAHSGAGYIWASAVCDPHTNQAFAIGGLTVGPDSNQIRIFNAATNTWAADGTPLSGTIYSAAAGLLVGGRIIVTAGYFNAVGSTATFIYSISGNTWTPGTNISDVATNAASGVGADGKFYVAGGNAGGGATDNVQVYDPISATWGSAPAMTWPVDLTAGAFVGSLFEVVGGTGFSNDPGCISTNNICNDNQQLETDCSNVFTDISGNIFYGAIHNLSCRGVVNGTSSTTFSPAGTSTRGQFAKVVVLGFGIPLLNPGTPSFTDVPASYFAYRYIEGGKAAGILSGFDQSTCTSAGATYPCYLPNRPITRGQLTKLVVSAAGYTLINPPTPAYTDVPTSSVFYQFIETAHSKGVVNGYIDNTFRPNNNIQRDQMCQIVYKGVTTP